MEFTEFFDSNPCLAQPGGRNRREQVMFDMTVHAPPDETLYPRSTKIACSSQITKEGRYFFIRSDDPGANMINQKNGAQIWADKPGDKKVVKGRAGSAQQVHGQSKPQQQMQ